MCKNDYLHPHTNDSAIIFVAFGTSVDSAREVFRAIDRAAKERYPNRLICWAFTSEQIRAKLKKRGIVTESLQEVINKLREKNISSAVCQSLHIVPGQEYHRILDVDSHGIKLSVGAPLLNDEQDFEAVIMALSHQIDPSCPTVIITHGNGKIMKFNDQIISLRQQLNAKFPLLELASVEGEPGTAPLHQLLRRCSPLERVDFIPLMLVSGDHVLNDVLGEDEDSWINILGQPEARCFPSLGLNPEIVQIFFTHLDTARKKLE